MEEKQSISTWQEQGGLVIADGPPAPTLRESETILAAGGILLARPSYYDHRHKILRQQLRKGHIGKLVALRLVRSHPADSCLPDGVTLNYAFDALDILSSLLGDVRRIMALEQRLRRQKPDMLFATLIGKDDAIGYLELSVCFPQSHLSERVEIIGRKGVLQYDSDVNRTVRVTTKQRVRVRDAFQDPPSVRMLREYMKAGNDDGATKAQVAATRTPLRLVFRALESSRHRRPA
jgi:predicted dehydrogenase